MHTHRIKLCQWYRTRASDFNHADASTAVEDIWRQSRDPREGSQKNREDRNTPCERGVSFRKLSGGRLTHRSSKLIEYLVKFPQGPLGCWRACGNLWDRSRRLRDLARSSVFPLLEVYAMKERRSPWKLVIWLSTPLHSPLEYRKRPSRRPEGGS